MHTSSLTAAQTPAQPPAVSEEYTSLILRSQYRPFRHDERYFEQVVNSQYSILYIPISDNLYAVNQIGYSGVPSSAPPASSAPGFSWSRRSPF